MTPPGITGSPDIVPVHASTDESLKPRRTPETFITPRITSDKEEALRIASEAKARVINFFKRMGNLNSEIAGKLGETPNKTAPEAIQAIRVQQEQGRPQKTNSETTRIKGIREEFTHMHAEARMTLADKVKSMQLRFAERRKRLQQAGSRFNANIHSAFDVVSNHSVMFRPPTPVNAAV